MARPQPQPSLPKAPKKEHPLAPAAPPLPPSAGTPPRQDEATATPSAAGRHTPAPAAAADAAVSSPELSMFATRLNSDLRRQLKVHAAQQNQTIQEVTEAALRAYLAERTNS